MTHKGSWPDDGLSWSEVAARLMEARNLAAEPRVVVHLGRGSPAQVPEVIAALAAKYTGEDDRRYLPDADPDFDVVYAIRLQSVMMWRLADYEGSQRRWTSGRSVEHGLGED
jgi:hypothetical protein